MKFLFCLINSFFTSIVNDIVENIEYKRKVLNLNKMSMFKIIYLITFGCCFLLGNFTAMIGIIFKESLGYGIIFPVMSCILLYGASFVTFKNILFFQKEERFFIRQLQEENK